MDIKRRAYQNRWTDLAELYVVTDKYHVADIKGATVGKFNRYLEHNQLEPIFAVADIIFSSVPESDKPYSEFLQSRIARFHRLGSDAEGILEKWIAQGGRLALEIYQVLVSCWTSSTTEAWAIFRQRKAERRRHDSRYYCQECFDSDAMDEHGNLWATIRDRMSADPWWRRPG